MGLKNVFDSSAITSKVTFVTGNKNKVKEAERILGIRLDIADIDIKEIQTMEVEEVVEEKAKEAYSKVGKTVIVEDTGIYLEELNGFPGALIKWLLDSAGNEGICNIIRDNRNAIAKTCICLYDGKEAKTFCGSIKGTIPEKPRGTTNFGWDPVFIPEGHDRTFAEMSQEEKNSMSMRKRALEKLKEFLN